MIIVHFESPPQGAGRKRHPIQKVQVCRESIALLAFASFRNWSRSPDLHLCAHAHQCDGPLLDSRFGDGDRARRQLSFFCECLLRRARRPGRRPRPSSPQKSKLSERVHSHTVSRDSRALSYESHRWGERVGSLPGHRIRARVQYATLDRDNYRLRFPCRRPSPGSLQMGAHQCGYGGVSQTARKWQPALRFLHSSLYDWQDANCKPLPRLSLTVGSCPTSSAAVQALEVTSLAALPDGSQKLLQYVVAPISANLNFVPLGSSGQSIPAALTLVGNGSQFTGPTGPNSAQFQVDGHDQCGANAGVYGIGYTNSITSAIPPANESSYSGAGKASPNVIDVTSSLSPNLQTPSGLDALVQTITQNADVVVNVPAGATANQSILPSVMSAGNPMTVVVNGDFWRQRRRLRCSRRDRQLQLRPQCFLEGRCSRDRTGHRYFEQQWNWQRQN
jgi:hypothetical protein